MPDTSPTATMSVCESGIRKSWKSPPSSRADANEAATSTPFSRFGQLRRQQRRLHALGELQLLLEPRLVRRDLLVEPRVLDRDGGLARQQRQDLDVALREAVELRTLEVEHADAAILQQHRNRQLRPHVVDDLDVARILRHVRHEHGLAMERGVPDQALAERDLRQRDLFAVLHGDFHLELVASASLRSRMPNVR